MELLLRAVWVGPVRVDVSVLMALCRHIWTRLRRCFGVLVSRGAAIAQRKKFRSLLLKGKAVNIPLVSVSAYLRHRSYLRYL
jgi:hypothetical protein